MKKCKCAHCQLEFDENLMIKSGGKLFCCTGCASVYEILSSSGLDEFYARLGKTTLEPVKLAQKGDENLEAIYQNYVKNDNGFNKISLVIEGIHYSTCI